MTFDEQHYFLSWWKKVAFGIILKNVSCIIASFFVTMLNHSAVYVYRERSLRGWQHNILSDAGLSTCKDTLNASVDPGGRGDEPRDGRETGANTRTYPDLLPTRVSSLQQPSVKLRLQTQFFFGYDLHSHPTVLWGNEGGSEGMEAFNRAVRSYEAL